MPSACGLSVKWVQDVVDVKSKSFVGQYLLGNATYFSMFSHNDDETLFNHTLIAF